MNLSPLSTAFLSRFSLCLSLTSSSPLSLSAAFLSPSSPSLSLSTAWMESVVQQGRNFVPPKYSEAEKCPCTSYVDTIAPTRMQFAMCNSHSTADIATLFFACDWNFSREEMYPCISLSLHLIMFNIHLGQNFMYFPMMVLFSV